MKKMLSAIVFLILPAALLLGLAACAAQSEQPPEAPTEDVYTPTVDPVSDNCRTF